MTMQTQAQPDDFWWEQSEVDAMFTAEMSGGPSLMERAAGPLLFLIVAGVVACAVIHVGRGMGLW